MEQLPLGLTPSLAYSPQGFVVHEGVRDLMARVLGEALQKRFSIVYIEGGRRSGKTHLSLRLALELSDAGRYPVLFEGEFFARDIEALSSRPAIDDSTVFIVDDIQRYFLSPDFSDSGGFVHFVEHLRVKGATFICLCDRGVEHLPVDEHVRSRLIPGGGYVLEAPGADDAPALLQGMARQRGINLKERKREFLLRRLRHDIPSIERFLDRILQISRGEERGLRYSLMRDAL